LKRKESEYTQKLSDLATQDAALDAELAQLDAIEIDLNLQLNN
jgi:hypothetical protein